MPSDHPNTDHQVLAVARNFLFADLVRIRLERDSDIRMDILPLPFSDDDLIEHLVGKVVVYAEYDLLGKTPTRLIQRVLDFATVPVIAVGENLSEDVLDHLADMGVAGYADRGIPASIVVPTVQSVVGGHYRFLSNSRRRCNRNYGLVESECALMRMVASGLTDKEIAERLGCDFQSVRNDLRKIFGKMGVRTRSQAVVQLSHCSCMRGVAHAC